MKRLYFETLGGEHFGLRIRGSLNDQIGKKEYVEPSKYTMELAGHIYYRLNMALRAVERIIFNWEKAISFIQENIKESHVFTDDKKGIAFRMDRSLEDDLRLDINSFLFESNSCCELIKEYYNRLNYDLSLYDKKTILPILL